MALQIFGGGKSGGSGGATVTKSSTRPASGLWLDTSGPNMPPTVTLSLAKTNLTATATFVGTDPNAGEALTYSINWGDGATTTPTTSPATHTYSTAGLRTVTITVTDERGATGTATGTITPTDPYTGGTYPVEVAADSPIIYFRLNETTGTTAVDTSGGTGRNGVYTNGPVLNQGSQITSGGGSSAFFDGTNDFVTSSAGATSWIDLTTVTFSMRYTPTDAACLTGDQYLGGRWGGAGQLVFFMELQGGKLGGAIFTTSQFTLPFASTPLVVGTTYTLDLTYDGTTARLFVNGSQVSSIAATGALKSGSTTAFDICRVANAVYGRGRISEVSVSPAVSPTRIANRHLAAIN